MTARRIVIVGGGRIGEHLARLLRGRGFDIAVVEEDPATAEALTASLPDVTVVAGSGTDLDVLERAGARRADALAVVTDRDEANLVAAGLARLELGVGRIVGRVKNPRNAWLYTPEMGIDVALDQATLIAGLVSEEITLGELTILLELRRGQLSLVSERVGPGAGVVGRRLDELDLPPGSTPVAVFREGTTRVDPALALRAGDEVVLLVPTAEMATVAAVLA